MAAIASNHDYKKEKNNLQRGKNHKKFYYIVFYDFIHSIFVQLSIHTILFVVI